MSVLSSFLSFGNSQRLHCLNQSPSAMTARSGLLTIGSLERKILPIGCLTRRMTTTRWTRGPLGMNGTRIMCTSSSDPNPRNAENRAYETAADIPAPTAPKSERVTYVRKRTIKLIKQLEVSLADMDLKKISNKWHKASVC